MWVTDIHKGVWPLFKNTELLFVLACGNKHYTLLQSIPLAPMHSATLLLTFLHYTQHSLCTTPTLRLTHWHYPTHMQYRATHSPPAQHLSVGTWLRTKIWDFGFKPTFRSLGEDKIQKIRRAIKVCRSDAVGGKQRAKTQWWHSTIKKRINSELLIDRKQGIYKQKWFQILFG